MGDAEYNSLLRLKEALEGAQKNTNRMLSRLEKFETRLSDIDEKMKPIQVTTGRYMKAKNNITETLQEVGKTYDYFRVANDVRETITRGYVANNQKEFLEAFKKLSQAKIFFQEHKEIKSAQSVLSSLESLLQVSYSSRDSHRDFSSIFLRVIDCHIDVLARIRKALVTEREKRRQTGQYTL